MRNKDEAAAILVVLQGWNKPSLCRSAVTGGGYFPKCRHAAAISECLDGPSRCVSRGAGITGRGNTGLQHGAWLKVKDALWHKAALGMRKLAFKIKEGLEVMDGWMDGLGRSCGCYLASPPYPPPLFPHLALWQVRVNREVTPANFHADDRRDYSKRRGGASHL